MTVVLHKQCDIKYKLLQTLPHGVFKIHSPQSNCLMNRDYQRSQKFWIYVKCEKHSTKWHKLNSRSMDITWSAIGSWFSFSATTVTCNILSFKPSHLISIIKRCLIWFIIRNSLLQNVKGNYLPGIPVMNQTQPNQTSHLFLLIQTFVLSSNQYVAAQSVQWLGYMLKGLGFKSWHKPKNCLFSDTSRPDPVATQPPTKWKPELFLWQ